MPTLNRQWGDFNYNTVCARFRKWHKAVHIIDECSIYAHGSTSAIISFFINKLGTLTCTCCVRWWPLQLCDMWEIFVKTRKSWWARSTDWRIENAILCCTLKLVIIVQFSLWPLSLVRISSCYLYRLQQIAQRFDQVSHHQMLSQSFWHFEYSYNSRVVYHQLDMVLHIHSLCILLLTARC